ncbi:MAG: hypothetical protein ACOY4U_11105 [Pseudomonadota bacterium]
MKAAVVLFSLALAVSGCTTTTGLSPQQAGSAATALFKGQDSMLIWVPAADNAVARAIASLFIGSIGLESPVVSQIHKTISPASSTDVRVAISGPDSRFAANATIAALENASAPLPRLQLAFMGSPSDSDKVRAAVEEKGGTFVSSAPVGR